MENKYYTPEIEEFHVGFEYEFNDIIGDDGEHLSDNWEKAIIKDAVQISDIHRLERGKRIYGLRVKLLDKEDIEQFRFKLGTDGHYYFSFDSNEGNIQWSDSILTIFTLKLADGIINIRKQIIGGIGGIDNTWNIFIGVIRNKSEFARLMNQLEISQNDNYKNK